MCGRFDTGELTQLYRQPCGRRIGHDVDVVFLEDAYLLLYLGGKRRVDRKDGARKSPAALTARGDMEKQIDVVFPARDLVEKVDVVHMRATVDVVMLWPLAKRPDAARSLWFHH